MGRITGAALAALIGLYGAAAAQDAVTGNHLAIIDANRDGAVDAAEFRRFMEATFTELDANGDGRLTQAEAAEIIPVTEFRAADTNGDGRLSLAEFERQVTEDFAKADLDGDGRLN